jgi:hypothetical protein
MQNMNEKKIYLSTAQMTLVLFGACFSQKKENDPLRLAFGAKEGARVWRWVEK